MKQKEELDTLRSLQENWEDGIRQRGISERRTEFSTRSEIPVKRVYTPNDLQEAGFDYVRDLHFPGQYPYTRGIEPAMYRERIRFPGGNQPEIQVPAESGDNGLYGRLGSSHTDGL